MSGERLYNLLPALYRIRDHSQGEPLRALLGIVEVEMDWIEADIDRLYDNAFIETCQEWVVPYIGDLLGARLLQTIGGNASLRPYVANTLAYRRRKGTAPVLEQLARDVTGWPARAVEFFQLLGTTQYINHIRLDHFQTPDLRHAAQLELLGSPFESAAYTADVRHIHNNRGKYNIPNIGLFLWRLQDYTVTQGSARRIGNGDPRYTFHPVGYDHPLFNAPQTERQITHLAEEINVPGTLRRRPLYDELSARRQALVEGKTPETRYFGEASPVFQLFLNGSALLPEEIAICNLSAWSHPPSHTEMKPNGETFNIKAAVDPLLGRLTLPVGTDVQTLQVSYAYGFSSDLGGGPYHRTDSIRRVLTREVTWQVGVSKEETPTVGGEHLYTTLAGAITEWNAQPAGAVGVIAIMDSRTYEEDLTGHTIVMKAGSQLLLVAADWPKEVNPDIPEQLMRGIGRFSADDLRPHLQGGLFVKGDENAGTPGELDINGLLIEGKLTIQPGNLGTLRLSHCTLVPDQGGMEMEVPTQVEPGQNDPLKVALDRTICGPITLRDTVEALTIEESIVDSAGGTAAIAAPGVPTDLTGSTVLGTTHTQSLSASNSLFSDTVTVERRQTGCIRFSDLPEDSKTPQRYQCQPDVALHEVVNPSERAVILGRLVPSFTSTQYGHPAYAQLSQVCAVEIRTGAEDGSEMGAFSHLRQPQRASNLRTSLKEYLRFGLEAGIFYIT
jgi:hypothetical protein